MAKKRSTKEKVNKPVQLDLGMRSPFVNIFYKIKERFKKTFIYFEIVSFARTPLNWFLIILSISLILIGVFYIYSTYYSLPSQIPMLSYFTSLKKKLVDTEYIFALPTLSLLILIVGSQVAYKYFHKEREMTNLLLFISLCSIFLITLLILRITVAYYG